MASRPALWRCERRHVSQPSENPTWAPRCEVKRWSARVQDARIIHPFLIVTDGADHGVIDSTPLYDVVRSARPLNNQARRGSTQDSGVIVNNDRKALREFDLEGPLKSQSLQVIDSATPGSALAA